MSYLNALSRSKFPSSFEGRSQAGIFLVVGHLVLHRDRLSWQIPEFKQGEQVVCLVPRSLEYDSDSEKRYLPRFDFHLPIFEQQFSKPTNGGLTQDGNSDFFNFSTGRRGVASLHTVFTLRPRHDLFQWVFQTLMSFVDLHYQPRDEIELDFTLLPGTSVPDFVWAIVSKSELLSIKQSRWDLVRPATYTVNARTNHHTDLHQNQ
jgi:hypothetical protein